MYTYINSDVLICIFSTILMINDFKITSSISYCLILINCHYIDNMQYEYYCLLYIDS